ncbi:hypothetical protein AcW1_000869 [Taiwanofungus camphoratus]|nr:hypothetical protein AcV7_000887 [Antrodia cinnamomea]KAI0963916.1 hypothetical protein AcW1_000869 [Antrodia cinnamomea]
MPAPITSHAVKAYTSANDLPGGVWDTFRAHPRESNIMFPHAEKARRTNKADEDGPVHDIWVVCTTSRSSGASPLVDFVLSCTEGPIASYPVFIFTPISRNQLRPDYIWPRLRSVAHALRGHVSPERVFSVFSLDIITRTFATIWTEETDIYLDSDPEYYEAKFTYCTKQTLKARLPTVFHDLTYQLRLAVDTDIPEAASLCHGFAAASEPFVLSPKEAVEEATFLVHNRQLWVHEVTAPGGRSEIASIVAVTRTSDTVAAITKVYTNPKWRQRGCAERLTRRVCQHLLKTQDSVVLYVARNNPAAAKVYHRVGFVGLSPESEPIEGVDPWLELGFERTLVNLGHW